jgi:glycosyltransferase involved in cell wall biosynthesis
VSAPKVCLVGTAPPRRCGIATFTDDLRAGLTAAAPSAPAVQIALTDVGGAYDYGPEVVFEVQAPQRSDYRTAAGFLDASDVDVVCVQHEFGIFGGPAGRHLDELLEHVHAPVVTTLHTVLPDPSPELRAATRRVVDRSDAVVVLAERAVELLVDGCGVDPAKVRVIPHGVPAAPDLDLDAAKEALGLTGRTVLLTFGLLGPDKGIEVVLDALPAVVREVPDVLYVVLGATHPHVLRSSGDGYRRSLQDRVGDLGLQDNVLFVDRYVELDELCLHLAASDVYLTPYHGSDQIVSGTLAYAVGMGCAVVSTPYTYARELLADGRGVLFPFGDARALAAELTALLAEDTRRDGLRRLAREHGAAMSWPAVAGAYLELFAEVREAHEQRSVPHVDVEPPAPSFLHLQALTDDVGVFQHAQHGVPTRAHGYCTDDVSRALAVCVEGVSRLQDPVAAALVPRYLSFLLDAQQADGRFANLMGYDRRFVAGTASQDTLGQALWGLGTTAALARQEGWRALAAQLVERALPAAAELHSTKAVAYAMTGLHGYLELYPGALAARRTLRVLAERQLAGLAAASGEGWTWPDDAMTYANAAVPEGLLRAGQALDEPEWVAAGLLTLDALLARTWMDGHFDFPGNEGWLHRDGIRARWGQQPIEAGLTVRACVLGHQATGEKAYLDRAYDAAAWLLGRNRLGLALYDPETGRCVDGLDRHGVSSNAGAESTVCALLGLVALPRPVRLDVMAAGSVV